MTDPPKPTLAGYSDWAATSHGHNLGPDRQQWYGIVTASLRQAVDDHAFGAGIHDALADAAVEYEQKTGTPLFGGEGTPTVMWRVKPYESVIDKLYRKNVLTNDTWPNEPPGGWYAPDQIFERLDDIVRTRLVCDYLDGPQFLVEKLNDFANRIGLEAEYSSREKDRGYYAYHVYVTIPVALVDLNWAPVQHMARVEIQATTRLQSVLDVLTHKQYEEARLKEPVQDSSWKWEHKTLRFKNAYLAHSLRLLEGVILEVRDHE